MCTCTYLVSSPKNWAAAPVTPPAAVKQHWVRPSAPRSPAARSTADSSLQSGTFEMHLHQTHTHRKKSISTGHRLTHLFHNKHFNSLETFFFPKEWLKSAGTSSMYLQRELISVAFPLFWATNLSIYVDVVQVCWYIHLLIQKVCGH